MTIELLQAVANDPKGAVLHVAERRGLTLIRTGYAVAVPEVLKTSTKKEEPWPKASRSR